MSKFAEMLMKLRKERGLSQNGLSRSIEIPKTTISNWEIRGSFPSYEAINKLADFFEVSGDYLLGREDEFGNPIPKQKR
ncbi:MAG: helix-turn-helix domain-containing protein [Firmicutes bacterium]|nr:helix-turn-helix domain-containing protein [Bacillota bacterium]